MFHATNHRIVSYHAVVSERLHWLWPQSIGLGSLTLLAGDPGLGKSFLTVDLAARVSRGLPWPNTSEQRAPRGSVVLLNGEDDPSRTIRPRLEAAGADLAQIVTLEAAGGDGIDGGNSFTLDRDMASLRQVVDDLRDCRLVIIDPISMFMGRVNSHLNTSVRSLLRPLAKLAARKHLAVVAVTHLNKDAGRKTLYRAIGSLAFIAAARSAKLVVADPADNARRLFLSVNNNLTPANQGLAFRLASEPGEVARVIWEPGEVPYTPDETLAPTGRNGGHNSTVVKWLAGTLCEIPIGADQILSEAKALGFSVDQVFRASKFLKVEKHKLGFIGGWQWSLPSEWKTSSSEKD